MNKCSIFCVVGNFRRLERACVHVSIKVTVKDYHCANGDGLFHGQIGFRTPSVRQFDGDCDGVGRRQYVLANLQ